MNQIYFKIITQGFWGRVADCRLFRFKKDLKNLNYLDLSKWRIQYDRRGL